MIPRAWKGRRYVGTSGFSYQHWIDVLYPKGLPPRRWLERYVQSFNTLELNTTFYHLPRESSVEGWRDQAPPGFLFAVKASRYLTHMRRLRNIEEPLRRFYRTVEILGDTAGPILFQLPPSTPRNDGLLDSFLPQLSRDYVHVVEFRHRSWFVPAVVDRLDRAGVATASVSGVHIDTGVLLSGPLVYLRFHGTTVMFGSRYTAPTLRRWAQEAEKAVRGSDRPIFAYFNNDAHGHAVRNARQMAGLLGDRVPRLPPRERARTMRLPAPRAEDAGRRP